MRLCALFVTVLVGCGQEMSGASLGAGGAAAGLAGSTSTELEAGVSSEAGTGSEAGAGSDAGAAGAGTETATATLVLPAICASDTKSPPTHLECTGLYADIGNKQIAGGVEPYAPAVPLWSDGAQKQRWVSLPAGQTIDNSDPAEWSFPIGTRFWKEFSVAGRRIETRLWQKTDTNYWVDATYAWNADESSALRSAGGDISLGTRTYHIPTGDECQKCHRGSVDRILGFDQVLLGLAGATGLNLERLIADRRLSRPPTSSQLVIGDDGTGLAAPALAWLHVNCGTTCHNRNSNATAWSTGLFMRLDPTLLDGRSVVGMDPLLTTIGVAAVTPTWQGRQRIVAGDPAHSLLFSLISHRGTGQQMPPIASSVVDEADIPLIEAWITQLPNVNAGTGGAASVGGGDSGGGRAMGAGGTGGAPAMGGASSGGTSALAGAGSGGSPAMAGAGGGGASAIGGSENGSALGGAENGGVSGLGGVSAIGGAGD